ncbi:hypothetical protein SAMN05216275_14011 [Streptosporangium canum]|uniref:Transposase DDE domain-containing protein n=1 Tax=Streptosporangium canum TaxID=324952 RepID=A0A1I4DA42_9ACTN|nr:hypothetical protein SAMN05216275_14011 [Streptosporangium canum]
MPVAQCTYSVARPLEVTRLAADRRCRPLAFVLAAGQAADSPHLVPVLQKVRIRLPVGRPRPPAPAPGVVAGDKAHSCRANRAYLRERHIKAVILRASIIWIGDLLQTTC